MRALYEGFCAACGKPIHILDEITPDAGLAETGFAAWRHVKCPVELHGTGCPKCHIERALDGSCECDS